MGRVLCGVCCLAGWRDLTRGRLAGVWPVWVALPPFSLCSAYRVTEVMRGWGVALGLQCGNVCCAAVVTNMFEE